MNSILQEALKSYWLAPEIAINMIIFLNLLGALVLGLIVGYERSYHGRAAGCALMVWCAWHPPHLRCSQDIQPSGTADNSLPTLALIPHELFRGL